MAFPDVEVSIARYSLGPLIDPYDRGYVSLGSSSAASYAFSASDLLDLTGTYDISFDTMVPFMDPADWAGTNPELVLAWIDDNSGNDLTFGVTFNIGEASGSDVAVMYATRAGAGTVYSDPVPLLDGINASPKRLFFRFSVSTGTCSFSACQQEQEAEYTNVASDPPYISYGSGSLGTRTSGAGTFHLLPVSGSIADSRMARCRLPGTAETNFDDHDGTGNYTDASRTWTMNNTDWRAGDWEDVTDRVWFNDAVTTTYGRNVDLGSYAPGVAGFVLDNQDGTWDPILNGTVRPWQQVRIRATFSGTNYNLFYGYVRSYRPEYREAGILPVVRVDCVDAFALFANRNAGVTATGAALQLAPEGLWPLNEANNATACDNAVFQQPPFDAATFNHSRSADPAYRGGRRHGSFDPKMHIVAADLPSTWIDPASWTVAGWVAMPAPNAGTIANADRTNLLCVKNSSDNMWWSIFIRNNSTRVWEGGVGVYNGTSNTYDVGPVLTDLAESFWQPAGLVTKFHHVAVTLTRGGSNTTATWYLNGVNVGNHTFTNRTVPTGDASMCNGDSDPADSSVIDGFGLTGSSAKWVAGLSLWTEALTAEQIAWLADNSLDGFVSERSDLRVARALDWFGWPSWRRDLKTGEVTLAEVDADGNNALATLQRMELSEFGDLYVTPAGYVRFLDRDYRPDHSSTTQETFDRPSVNAPYSGINVSYDDELVLNVIRLIGTNGTVIERDLASIRGGNGHREFTRTVDTEVSQNQASQILAQFKDPKTRPRTMVVKPTRDDTRLFPQVLGRGIPDKIAIVIPVSGTDPTLTARIARVTHVFNTEDWTTTWGLESA